MAEETEKKTTRKSTKLDAELVEKLVQDAFNVHMNEFLDKFAKDMQAKIDENKPEVIRTDKAETQVYNVGGETFISLPMVEGLGVDALYPFKNGTVLLTADAYRKAKNAIEALDIDYCIADLEDDEEVEADDDVDEDEAESGAEEDIDATKIEALLRNLKEAYEKDRELQKQQNRCKAGKPRVRIWQMTDKEADRFMKNLLDELFN